MKKRIIALALAALMLVTVGCEAELRQLAIEMAMAWAAENGVDIIKYNVWGRSGNDEVDAVLNARSVIANINEADRLMEEGREENDLSKMENAIEKRPGDYTYRVSYGTALLREGRTDEAKNQFGAADDAVLENYSDDHIQSYAIQGIDELGALRPEFEEKGFVSAEQCETYYSRLALFYELRYAATEQDYFLSQQNLYTQLAGTCR